ncbi:MAG: hypothetical protein L0G70_01085, partial [Rubrobacter sp.]|nr:hypothetical protein [Rubrobacter sp.]
GRMTINDCAGECGEPASALGEREANEQKEAITMQDFFGEVIHSYTRAEALEDGVLVDVSQTASEAGFVFPVALTAGVWADVNDIPESKQGIQDVDGRLWDLLFSAAQRCKKSSGKRSDEEDGLPFDLIMHVGEAPYYHAKVHLGPGDEMEPVITILGPDED